MSGGGLGVGCLVVCMGFGLGFGGAVRGPAVGRCEGSLYWQVAGSVECGITVYVRESSVFRPCARERSAFVEVSFLVVWCWVCYFS